MEKIIQAKYEDHKKSIVHIRHTVFVIGQNVPSEIEIDGKDPQCFHALITIDDTPIATGRMEKDGHIGRIAVLEEYRGHHYGQKIMGKLEEIARNEGIRRVYLGSQVHAMNFYEKLGYTPYGEFYFEAGIEHRRMQKSL
ncbi:MAG: GNAT family N-acetyltransferase [Candidatus Delongbacteria bacterium]|jgi:predicted GNAT family N-acyltransferase|nr:GNAT family N-acetyltransferase [Candidatus Delongbacteria bacterium]